jgi:hypothetical protein
MALRLDQSRIYFEILVLDFIQNIDVSDSPFKGPADAAVTIAVFSDFQ